MIDVSTDQTERPIKVMMESEEHKDRIMANLKELKGKEQYKGISGTDDYTIKDRNMITEWIEKAKKANEEEPTESQYEWKYLGQILGSRDQISAN